jgi:excisionase family DNA binding protein
VDDAAALLGGVCTNTVRREIDRGELTAVKVGRRRMIDPHDLREYIESRKTNGPVAAEPSASATAGGDGSRGPA